ncbi:hypothetical protein [Chondromyces apiculatus]|uniref:Cell surface protein n=1 Tax=Chondromyces apiculatus DSM 436 TaxID=1192034 RepID=A0A017T403_9BACT|nr:hypothetical protein [Chondromyces apiculatus]EYF03530.1 Hypothetical protein CAP_5514 [Chondromyces apiculatus DSM 436]
MIPALETCADPGDENCDGKDCLLWAHTFGDVTEQGVSDVAVDQSGNTYVAGSFRGTLTFGSNNPLLEEDFRNIYLAKLDARGIPVWSKRFGAPFVTVSGLSIDSMGNVVMTGAFSQAISFDEQTLTTSESAYSAAFITKLSPDGDVHWSVAYENGEQDTRITRPAIGEQDEVYVFGEGSCEDLCGLPAERLWLRKYDAGGAVTWSKNFPYSESIRERYAGRVVIDGENQVIITGAFGGSYGDPSINFGGSDMVTSGDSDAFVVKFSDQGEFVRQGQFAGDGDQRGTDLVVDDERNIIIAGENAGVVFFNGQPSTSAGLTDIFIVKLTPEGHVIWRKSYGSSAAETSALLSVGTYGSIVFAVQISEPVNFGAGPIGGSGGTDLAFVKLAPDGSHVWSKAVGDSADQKVRAVASVAGGETVIAAEMAGGFSLGGYSGHAVGGSDIFVMRIGQ